MKYTAEDNHIIISEKDTITKYSCPSIYLDGVYESFETTSSNNELGIQQIKITRNISNGICNYEIIESTIEELQNYLNEIKINNI